jgi:hypothetical protein
MGALAGVALDPIVSACTSMWVGPDHSAQARPTKVPPGPLKFTVTVSEPEAALKA